MSPREQVIRAACVLMGVDPAKWHAFRDLGDVAIAALLSVLPAHLGEAVRQHLDHPGDPT